MSGQVEQLAQFFVVERLDNASAIPLFAGRKQKGLQLDAIVAKAVRGEGLVQKLDQVSRGAFPFFRSRPVFEITRPCQEREYLGAIFLLVHDGVFQGLEVAPRGAEAAMAYPFFQKGEWNPVLLHETAVRAVLR